MTIKTNSEKNVLSMPAIILLHLLPGIPILFISLVLSNPVWGFGLPFFLALLLASVIGLIPVQLGIIYYYSKKECIKFSEAIGFTNKMPISKTILWVILLFAFSFIVVAVIPTIEKPLWTIFDWIPDWFRINKAEEYTTRMALLISILGLTVNGILAPIVEELYFRGFLLPRMGQLGKWAPLVNAILFSLYHFFSPWENITRILMLVPYVYVVWYKKNIRIGILTHCILNISTMFLLFVMVLLIYI